MFFQLQTEWQNNRQNSTLTLKAPITTAADDTFYDIILNFQNKKYDVMRIVCQQTISMISHAFFVIFEK